MMESRHLKYPPGSIVMLRQLESGRGSVVTIWGGQVLKSEPTALTVLAIEMVHTGEWHCTGGFQTIKAPPHRQPYGWGFPRLLSESEAGADLEAKRVIETALKRYRAEGQGGREGAP